MPTPPPSEQNQPEPRHVPLPVLRDLGLDPARVVDHVAGVTPAMRDEAVQLAPYQSAWLTAPA